MNTDLGFPEKTYKPTAMGTYNYLGAALLSVVAGVFFIHYGFTSESGLKLKQILGGGMCLLLAGWMANEFLRLRRVSFTLHLKGMTTSEGARFAWTDVIAIESRYVPGLRKKGTADDGNIASAYILARGQQPVMLPRELGPPELHDLLKLVSARSGAPVTRVLIANLTQR
jgi:hypothetical protein